MLGFKIVIVLYFLLKLYKTQNLGILNFAKLFYFINLKYSKIDIYLKNVLGTGLNLKEQYLVINFKDIL